MEKLSLEGRLYPFNFRTHGQAQGLCNGLQGETWQASITLLPILIVGNGTIQREKEQARELKAAGWSDLLQPGARGIQQPVRF